MKLGNKIFGKCILFTNGFRLRIGGPSGQVGVIQPAPSIQVQGVGHVGSTSYLDISLHDLSTHSSYPILEFSVIIFNFYLSFITILIQAFDLL